MGRVIIIGDVHGCIEELDLLLEKLILRSDDHICFIGDLIDKGPHSVDVVRRYVQLTKEYIVTLILGNHEEKFFRYLHHVSAGTGIERQMKGIEEFPTFMTELTKEEIDKLKEAFYTFKVENLGIVLLHGGISNVVKFPFPENYPYNEKAAKQFKGLELITKIRFLNPNDKFVGLGEEGPEDTYWAERYTGKFGHVYFGHQPFIQPEPKRFPFATGLDTGCVFGGWLTAVVLENGKDSFCSIKALKTYASVH